MELALHAGNGQSKTFLATLHLRCLQCNLYASAGSKPGDHPNSSTTHKEAQGRSLTHLNCPARVHEAAT